LFIESHQLSVTPDLQLCSRRAGAIGGRVEGIAVVDMVVLVHGSVMPVGDIVRLAIIWQEFRLLLFLKDHQR